MTAWPPKAKASAANRFHEARASRSPASHRSDRRPNAHATSTSPRRTRVKAIENLFGRTDLKNSSSSDHQIHDGHLRRRRPASKRHHHHGHVEQTAPPTRNIVALAPQCRPQYSPNKTQPLKDRLRPSNSFGFGGTNGSSSSKRWTNSSNASIVHPTQTKARD